MDGLRELADRKFQERQKFRKSRSESDFDVIRISVSSPRQVSYQKHPCGEHQLVEYLGQPMPTVADRYPEATLQLVSIPRDDHETLLISQETFQGIFRCFGIERYVLYLISRNSYGLHHFETRLSENRVSYTFFIGTVLYVLIWSFDPHTMATKAIMLPRRGNGLTDGTSEFDNFEAILKQHLVRIYTPRLLAFVVTVHVIHFVDDFIIFELGKIRSIESETRHGAYSNPLTREQDQALDIGDISKWSREIGTCLVNLANQHRHEEIASALILFVRNPIGSDYRLEIDDRHLQNHDADVKELRSVLTVLQRQLDSTRTYISYLQERARVQSSVLFGLLTHADALINTDVGNSSNKIAAATKKDSEAMKTIAFMTMAFFPGTFFAALFAVPSLAWDQPWVYWVFSLPATAMIFVVWFRITDTKLAWPFASG